MTALLALNGWLVDASAFGSDEHPETPVFHPETDARGGLGGSVGSALAGLDGTRAEPHYNKLFKAGGVPEHRWGRPCVVWTPRRQI